MIETKKGIDSVRIAVRIPLVQSSAIDAAANRLGSDRSKIVRAALDLFLPTLTNQLDGEPPAAGPDNNGGGQNGTSNRKN